MLGRLSRFQGKGVVTILVVMERCSMASAAEIIHLIRVSSKVDDLHGDGSGRPLARMSLTLVGARYVQVDLYSIHAVLGSWCQFPDAIP